MQKFPHIRFQISAARDMKTVLAFSEDASYDEGRNLDWAVFKKYPELQQYFDAKFVLKNKTAIRAFVERTYQVDEARMERAMQEHEMRWKKMEPRFVELVARLFGERKWPRGKYIAYGTIWGMYPRFLEDKTFQIPYKHRKPRYVPVVIAHEVLHFMFYDYFYARYPRWSASKHNFFAWNVSEIFNTIVQNSPAWVSCFGMESMGYPEHEKIVKRMSRKLYRTNIWNLDEMVDEIVKEAKGLASV